MVNLKFSIVQREVNNVYYNYNDDKYSVSENIIIQFENNNSFLFKSAKSNYFTLS